MKKSTFILIVSIYGLLLATSMLFLSADAVKYFGGNPENSQEIGLMKFIGIVHLAFNFLGINLRKTEDATILKGYFLAIAIATFGGHIVSAINIFVYNTPIHATAFIDWSIWAVIGATSLYFYFKTK